MTPEEIKIIVTMINRAPLQNMQEAVFVSDLIQRFEKWYKEQGTSPKDSE